MKIVGILILGAVILVSCISVMDDVENRPMASHDRRGPALFDRSPAMQTKRLAVINEGIKADLFTKVVDVRGASPQLWVGRQFKTLTFDQKQAVTQGVFSYFYDGAEPLKRIRLFDGYTGKDIGDFTVERGLDLD